MSATEVQVGSLNTTSTIGIVGGGGGLAVFITSIPNIGLRPSVIDASTPGSGGGCLKISNVSPVVGLYAGHGYRGEVRIEYLDTVP